MLRATYSRKKGLRSMKIGRYLSPFVFSYWSLSLTIWFWQRECRFSLYRLPDALQCKLVHLLYFNSAKLRFKLSLISSMISFSSEQSILEAVPQKFRVWFFFFFWSIYLEKSMLLCLLNYSYLFHWKSLVTPMYLDMTEEIKYLAHLNGVSAE